jgi:hypothetical protein
MKKIWIVLLVILLLAGLSALFLWLFPMQLMFLLHPPEPRADAAVRDGSYWRITQRYITPMPLVVDVVRLEIDRSRGKAVFTLRDGSSVQATLPANEAQAQWAEGCHSMAGSTKMEYLPLAVDKLVLGDITFVQPYLAGTCPAPPFVLVLGEGRQDVSGVRDASFCAWYTGKKCIYFGMEYVTLHIQARDRASNEPLPNTRLTLQAPWGEEVFEGYGEVRLPGEARFAMRAEAPGYIPYWGEIKIESGTVILYDSNSTDSAPIPSAIEKIVTTEEVNLPVYLDSIAGPSTPTPQSTTAPYPTATPFPPGTGQ